jgi:hypothetical protein
MAMQVTLPMDLQHLADFKAYQESDQEELKRLATLKLKYLEPSNIRKPSQLLSILQYVEDINSKEFRSMNIPQLQQEIWQWFIDFPQEKKTFLDFRWGTSGYTVRCSSYQVAKKRIKDAGYYFSEYTLMSTILELLENEDPHVLCRRKLEA